MYLELPSTTTWKQGPLILSRLYCRAPLQMDVNLVTTSFQFSLDDALERHIGVAAGNSSQRESQLESVELISFKSLFQDEANLLQAITPKKHGTRFIVARVQG